MVTRRAFIQQVSALTGSSYAAMLSLGMIPEAPATPLQVGGNAAGKRVLILGAGLAGMAAAYQLNKLGYVCTILEARNRSGGRIWTVRGDTQETEIDGQPQTARFDEGLYINAGATRIPHHHQSVMQYCRELGIQLEVFNNLNEGAFVYSQGTGSLSNRRIRMRELHNDMRGYTSELLAKAISQDALDMPVTQADKEKIVEYLIAEGGLNPDKLYKGSSRRGYATAPGAYETAGKLADPHQLAALIQSGFVDPYFYNIADYTYEQQMTMFEPVGGMDALSKALEKKVGKNIVFNAEVQQIKNTADGASVVYKLKDGSAKKVTGDFCICTIPLPVLSAIENNFSSDLQRAIDFIPYNSTGKIGLQFKRRFWEEDDQIFGGISRTNLDITQILYPSSGYLSKKGVLVGYYNFGGTAERIGNLSVAAREKMALEQGSQIHPQYAQEFEHSFSLAWQKVKYSQGGWATYTDEARQQYYPALLKPEGNVYLAGEHTSYLTAWIAGSFDSAHRTVEAIHNRVRENASLYR